MRKLSLLISSCIAVVALAAFSAPAFGVTKVDPACDGDPYPNDLRVREFTITYTSKMEHAVSGYTAAGIACGTEISGPPVGGGAETLFNNAKVRQAPGEVTNSTAAMLDTTYVGDGEINAASWVLGIPAIIRQPFSLRTDPISECERENNEELKGGPEPGEVVACYKGTTVGQIPGHNWNWVMEQGDRDITVIGPFYNEFGREFPAGMTRVWRFSLCAYAGDTGAHGEGGICGDKKQPPDYSKPVRKNGDHSVDPLDLVLGPVVSRLPTGRHDCSAGYGNLSVTATINDGLTTPAFGLCTKWYKQGFAVPGS